MVNCFGDITIIPELTRKGDLLVLVIGHNKMPVPAEGPVLI